MLPHPAVSGRAASTATARCPPYNPDILYNYELGWKTSWDHGELRWNGAVFWENWDNFQFSFLGQYSLTADRQRRLRDRSRT